MKKLKFLSLLVLGMCLSIQVFARKNVVLKGSWNRVEKSINPEIPIQIWLEDSNKDITVQFFENLGPVKISGECKNGNRNGNIMYDTVLGTTEMSTFSITLDDAFIDTEYRIIVSNVKSVVNGLFSINYKYIE